MTITRTQPLPTHRQGPVPGNSPATAGFCLGVVGTLVGLLPFVGFLVTVPALLLSRAGRRRFRTGAAATPGLSTAGLVLGWVGSALCGLMTVVLLTSPVQPAPVQPAPAAPVLLGVPNVVGMGDVPARDTLRAAGFTNVVLGPSTGPAPGVPAGTVTTQLPGASALASAGDPIVLGEAAEPPAPPVVPQSAPVTAAPTATAAPTVDAGTPAVDTPDVDVDRPRIPVAPRHVASPAAPSGGSATYYANCSAARAAGAAPLYRGQPGYAPKLDRDDDGIACE